MPGTDRQTVSDPEHTVKLPLVFRQFMINQICIVRKVRCDHIRDQLHFKCLQTCLEALRAQATGTD